MTHDPSYKLLFSKPRMVADLLRGVVPQPWVAPLDFSSLETLNVRYVSKTLNWRESDVVWRVRFRKDGLYVLLLIEF